MLRSAFSIVFLLPWIFTQPLTAVARDPAALLIAQQAVAAMGGDQAIAQFVDCQATGQRTNADGTTQAWTLYVKGAQNLRVELSTHAGTSVMIINGGKGTVTKADGSIVPLSSLNTQARYLDYVPLLSILSQYQNTSVGLAFLGTDQVNGSAVNVISLDQSAILGFPPEAQPSVVKLYVDSATGLVLKMEAPSYGASSSDVDTIDVILEDYRTIGAIAVPFSQTVSLNGDLDSTLQINSVAFGVGLSDNLFTLPQ